MSQKQAKPLKEWLPATKRWFTSVLDSWELDGEYMELLFGTAANLDRYWRCEEILAAEGLTIVYETGQIRKHPASEISKNSWAAFLAGVRQLKLEDPAETRRPGRPDGGSLLASMPGGLR